jgi:tRNA dimethylallyltransferase
MFIDALCIGLDPIPASKELREELTEILESSGLEELLAELEEKDPEFYDKVDRNNPARVIRAIEAIRLSGESYSSLRKKQPETRPFKAHRFVIDHDRDILYDRINRRVDIMMNEGLLEEARSVHHLKHLSSLKTVGYRELFEHFEGEIDLETAVDNIKQNTRRYAKRQLTWFRRHPDAHWIPFGTNEEMMKKIISIFDTEKSSS